jgi:hypothetical protein
MLAMAELLTAIGTLAIILIGIAILLQITSVEEAFGFMGRAVSVFVLMIVALGILKGLWVGVIIPWLSAAFEFLKTLIAWLVITILSLVALSLFGRVVLRRAGRYLTLRRDPQTGDGYDINDPKDTKD